MTTTIVVRPGASMLHQAAGRGSLAGSTVTVTAPTRRPAAKRESEFVWWAGQKVVAFSDPATRLQCSQARPALYSCSVLHQALGCGHLRAATARGTRPSAQSAAEVEP